MVTVDWANGIINVPQSYLTFISGTLYELDLDQLRLDLKDLEDDETGMAFDDTHRHFAPITIGTTTLAQVVEFINGYTVTFEDGQYAVNVVGGNSNIADVLNRNQVSVLTNNSAGLVVAGSGVDAADLAALAEAVWTRVT